MQHKGCISISRAPGEVSILKSLSGSLRSLMEYLQLALAVFFERCRQFYQDLPADISMNQLLKKSLYMCVHTYICNVYVSQIAIKLKKKKECSIPNRRIYLQENRRIQENHRYFSLYFKNNSPYFPQWSLPKLLENNPY